MKDENEWQRKSDSKTGSAFWSQKAGTGIAGSGFSEILYSEASPFLVSSGSE